jgi:hypothetical protein
MGDIASSVTQNWHRMEHPGCNIITPMERLGYFMNNDPAVEG